MHIGLCSINTIKLLYPSCCVLHPQWKRVSQLIWNSVAHIGSGLGYLTDSSLSTKIHKAYYKGNVEAEPEIHVSRSGRQKSKEKKRGTFSLNALLSVSTSTSTSASTLISTATSTSCTLTSTSATRWPPPWNSPCPPPPWNPPRPWPPGSWFMTEVLLVFAHLVDGWGALALCFVRWADTNFSQS